MAVVKYLLRGFLGKFLNLKYKIFRTVNKVNLLNKALNIFIPQNIHELTNYLCKNVIYHKPGLLQSNKSNKNFRKCIGVG